MTFLQTRRLSQKRFLDAYRLKAFNSVSKNSTLLYSDMFNSISDSHFSIGLNSNKANKQYKQTHSKVRLQSAF